MKIRVYLSFNEGRSRYDFVRTLLLKAGCGIDDLAGPEDFLCGLYGHTFDADDPVLASLRKVLSDAGVKWSERVEHIYSVKELKQFPFLRLGVNRKSIDGGLPREGALYDLSSACPQCGTGAVQVSPLLLVERQLPRKGDLVTTYSGHLLISEHLAQAFREHDVTGVELRQALAKRTQAPLPWWQVLCGYTMPPAGPQTRGLIHDISPGWGCPVCNRDMYAEVFSHPLLLVYSRSQVDPAALPDIVQTWECFGRSVPRDDPARSLIRGYAQPLILIGQKVFAILLDLKVRDTFYTPVKIE